MKHSRLLSLFTLITFLPLAAGCSTVRPLSIPDDPGTEEDPLRTEEPMAISGYLDRMGEEHDWNGLVQMVGVDSLEFTRPARTGGNAPPSDDDRPSTLRLARGEVSGLMVPESQPGRTALLITGVTVGFIALMVAALMTMELDNMDIAGGYQGK